jgi:hypothetical protein
MVSSNNQPLHFNNQAQIVRRSRRICADATTSRAGDNIQPFSKHPAGYSTISIKPARLYPTIKFKQLPARGTNLKRRLVATE